MIGLELLVLLLLAGLSIFLASVEASFHLLKRRRLAQVTHHDEAMAELASSYLEDPPRLLMPVHLGTYTAHIGMTVIITSLLFGLVTYWAMLTAFAVMMAYLLLFRVSVPYILVHQDPERAFLRLLPAFHVYARALTPVVARLRRRAAPEDEDDAGAPPMPEVPPPPVQEADENRLAEALGRFSETVVREVMTPRPDVTAIAAAAPVAELRQVIRETKYSRIPVYGENLDEIQGVVDIRDLLDHDVAAGATVAGLARPARLVPETKHIAELLREMQAERFTFAVVIDEYGATAGIVSVEDIVEELVGEIQDEFDVEPDPLSVEADGAVLAEGRVGVDRLQEALEAELSVEEGVETVGGLVTTVFGRIPRVGERTTYLGFEIEVLDAEEKRVNRARFRRIPVPDAA
ncbi:MAG: hemolysin family protein [Acidobacteria bacterium]|nr:hemolysin family protein [Acidobacteriota bacterium]